MKEKYSISESSFEENKMEGKEEKASELLMRAHSSPGPSPAEQCVHFSSISMPARPMNFQKN